VRPVGLCEAGVGYCLAIRGPVGLTLLQPRVGEVSFLATISGVHLEDLHQTGRSDTLREGYLSYRWATKQDLLRISWCQ
jgi:hypothetical protein